MKRSALGENRRGFSTIAGGLIILSLVVLFTVTFVAVESTYHSYSALRDSLENRKRAESFFLLSSSVRGDFIVVFNGGSNLLHVVSVYVNHILTASVSVYIDPKQSQPVLSFTTMLTGDLITVVSDLGNRVSVPFPVIGPSSSSFLQNKYVGTGPLAITFANWSFVYQLRPSGGGCIPVGNQTAWPGIPKGTNKPIFFVALINHAHGNITLLDSSVMNFQLISATSQSTKGYFIIGSGSNACQINQYSSRPPYLIPENSFGDIASGGQPILVGFGASDINSNSNNENIWNTDGIAAAFLSLIYIWHTLDSQGNIRNEVYSQDIPFAALRICTPVGGVCT